MFLTEWQQRSAGEFAAVLGEAGFRGLAVTPTHGYYAVVSARKP